MKNPYSCAVDYEQNVYIADTANHRIRMIAPTRIITTVAGGGCGSSSGNSGDGGAATLACLNTPRAVAVSPDGASLYIADSGNQRVRVVDLSSGDIDHFAGNSGGSSGSTGDTGLADAAYLNTPRGVAVDEDDLYIADSHNHTIRRVDLSTGIISRIAGTIGVSGDTGSSGPGTSAKLDTPSGLALSSSYLYVADSLNDKVKRVALSGYYIYDYAGTGSPGYSGEGTATSEQLDEPLGVAVDLAGAVLIADADNNRIRKVASGTISAIVGDGTAGSSGDDSVSTSARVDSPASVCVDRMGNIFVADRDNSKVRKIFE